MIDTQQPGSPGWWLHRLIRKLGDRREHYAMLDSYYTGENSVPVNTTKTVREAYRRLMALGRTNFAELVVEAVRERMAPVGFRTGADGDELGDKEAWRIWQANSLDADFNLILRAKLAMGDSYVIVGGVDPDIDAPLITAEDPREVITEHDPRHRRKVRAALKVFSDDVDSSDWAYLYLPGKVYRAARERSAEVERHEMAWEESGWEWDGADSLQFEVVPVVRFANRADHFGTSKGEFEPHLPVLNRINYGILNRLEIATLQAFRQRALKGAPTHDAEGREIDYDDIFNMDPAAMWHLPETAEIWESGQVDLGPLLLAHKDDVQDLAAVSRTPLYYLTPDAANGSAEGAGLAREGLVFKTKDRIVETSEDAEAVMALAFMFAGDEQRASRRDMECLWAPPERLSLSERADAASKAPDIPWRTKMTDIWQFSPQAVERMETERVADSILAEAAAPQLPPVNAPVA